MVVVEDMIVAGIGSRIDTVSFTIVGRPLVQNGMRFARSSQPGGLPMIYHPKASDKAKLRAAVEASLRSVTATPLPIFQKTALTLDVEFHMNDVNSRDYDNMTKILQDSLQGPLFDNDKYIYRSTIAKIRTTFGKSELTLVKIIATGPAA